MPSRNRRVRLYVLLTVGIVTIWIWGRHSKAVDIYREHGAEKAVGGGSVLRPDLQRPEMHESIPPSDLLSDRNSASTGHETSHSDTKAPVSGPSERKPAAIVDDFHHDALEKLKEVLETTTTPPTPKTTTTSTKPKTSTKAVVTDAPTLTEDDLAGGNPNGLGGGRVEVSVNPQTTTTADHWTKLPEHYPISSMIQLPTGTSIPLPRVQREANKLASYGADEEKLEAIKEAAVHSWKNYRLFAFQQDEVKPVSHDARNPFNGWGATLVDSLDTLWIMGLHQEFEEAVVAVGQIDFTTSVRDDIPLFETVIRYLGGLIAAYDVSGKQHRVLLDKAVQLAEVLYSAFDTPNRAPQTYFRWQTWNMEISKRAGGRVILAELGTLSLEFTRLAQLTGEPKYYDAIARLTDMFEEWQHKTRLPGMWPTTFDASGCGDPATVEEPDTPAKTEAGPVGGRKLSSVSDTALDHDGSEKLRGQPGTLSDDGPGLFESEEDFFNHEAHGNTYKKRQIDVQRSDIPFGKVVEHGMAKTPAKTDDKTTSDSSTTTTTTEEKPKSADADAVPKTHSQSFITDSTENVICSEQGFVSMSRHSMEQYTLAGMSDSMYEYLPKEYLLLGGQVDKYRTMYLDSMKVAIDKLLYKPMSPTDEDILISGSLNSQMDYSKPDEDAYTEKFIPEAAHLACFAGGMFALGGVIFDKPEHVEIGSKLTEGCVWLYNSTVTGIMPEGSQLMQCENTWGKCEWDEKEYWKAIDPMWDTRPTKNNARLQSRLKEVPSSDAGHHSGSENHHSLSAPEGSSFKSTVSVNEKSNEASELTPKPAHEEARDVSGALAKRQLAVPAITENEIPTPTEPEPSTTSESASDDADTDDSMYTIEPISHEEYVRMTIQDQSLPPGFLHITSSKYMLRPEAIESVFYMYRITGNQHWREVGWNMFQAINTHTRAEFGYSTIYDVMYEDSAMTDEMESFWLAETLKYFWLLFDDPTRWSLDDWVLNTEAHLFRRPEYEVLKRRSAEAML